MMTPPRSVAVPQARTARETAIRVMIVDDSIVARAVLARALEGQPDFKVVAQAGGGAVALALAAQHPVDIILLDLEMPGMNGLDALPELIARTGARVLVVSSSAAAGAQATLTALRLGAADTLLKPEAGGMSAGFATALVDRLRKIAANAPGPKQDAAPVARGERRITALGNKLPPMECLAIGASTGGVHALAAFFAALPGTLSVPILVTQHLPAPFMPYYAGQLKEMSGRPACVATDGLRLSPDMIVLAPGDAHLAVVRGPDAVHVRLERRPAESGCLPSVDPMLASVARVYGSAGLGMMLSGMGRDGLAGAEQLVAAGGEMLAQDSASSVVWGMPGAVTNRGLAAAVLPPRLLARRVVERARTQEGVAAWK